MTFVDLKNVSLTYRLGKETTLALADATLGIDKGEFIAVVGPSGCGKSTIMKLVTGLLPASGGEVTVAGRKVTGPIKGVGMAFQNPTLMPWRTTIDNILLPMEVVEPHKRRFRSNRAEYVERAMKLTHSDAGSLLLMNEDEGGDLYFKTALGEVPSLSIPVITMALPACVRLMTALP